MRDTLPIKSIDDYLTLVPEPARTTLEKLRQVIRTTAPKAEETISYGIPSYKLDGMLVGFGFFKNHCTFFVMSNTLLKEKAFKDELKGYKGSLSGIHFPHDKMLPVALVKKIVKARMKYNAEKQAAKAKKKK